MGKGDWTKDPGLIDDMHPGLIDPDVHQAGTDGTGKSEMYDARLTEIYELAVMKQSRGYAGTAFAMANNRSKLGRGILLGQMSWGSILRRRGIEMSRFPWWGKHLGG